MDDRSPLSLNVSVRFHDVDLSHCTVTVADKNHDDPVNKSLVGFRFHFWITSRSLLGLFLSLSKSSNKFQ